MELSTKDTKMIQGLSVMAMVCLHLFDTYEYQGLFTPLIFFQGLPLSFYIAQLSDFCVFGFAFCSGYAHMTLFDKEHYYKRRMKSLLFLLIDYWVVLSVFSILSCIIGQASFMPGSFSQFLLTASTINISYNGAWWYMFAYVLIVLTSPFILSQVKKRNPIIILIISFVIYFIAFYYKDGKYSDLWIVSKLRPVGAPFFEYILGAVIKKYSVFSVVYSKWDKINSILKNVISVVIMLILLYGHTKIIATLFIAPFTGLIIVTLFHFWNKPKFVCKFFTFVGKHSTNIWLTHMFFYLVLFKNLVYIGKYPLIIFIIMMCITIIVSILLKQISGMVKKLLDKVYKVVNNEKKRVEYLIIL